MNLKDTIINKLYTTNGNNDNNNDNNENENNIEILE